MSDVPRIVQHLERIEWLLTQLLQKVSEPPPPMPSLEEIAALMKDKGLEAAREIDAERALRQHQRRPAPPPVDLSNPRC